MQVPVSWLLDFLETDATAATIAGALTARGFPVEKIESQPTPERIVVGEIQTLEPHPDADRLLVAMVDVGHERLQIVTGARNISAGDKVPIALIGSVVYTRESSDRATPQTKVIRKSTLRGIDSIGMMCSAAELALPGIFEDGIVVLERDAQVGENFWRAAKFGSAVLDIEVPSNRADCLSILGLAREAAAGLGVPLREPVLGVAEGSEPSPIAVEIADTSVCRRLLGQHFRGLTNRRSPLWMTLRLHAARFRSHNFLIDVSNYVQIETGQPLHFYDAQRIKGGRIIARSARNGERVLTLDGVERILSEGVPVIADASGPIGIAGIFGGMSAAVTDRTENLFLESPNFVGPRVRRASIALGLRTEAAARHERDLPLELTDVGRRRAARLLIDAGAAASAVVNVGENAVAKRTVDVRPQRVNAVLGSSYRVSQMQEAVKPLGIILSGTNPLRADVPWWRTDLAQEVDIMEEIARSIGFDAIIEQRTAAAPQTVDQSAFRQETLLSQAFAALGFREVVNLALQGSKVVAAWERSGLSFWSNLVHVVNPLSDDQRFLRPSLLPGLLSVASRAWSGARDPVALFEIGHIFRSDNSSGQVERPSLSGLCAFALEDVPSALDRHLLEVKGRVEFVVRTLTGDIGESLPYQRPYYHPGAAGRVSAGKQVVSTFGRLHPTLSRAYELPSATYAFCLFLEHLPAERPLPRYKNLPKFPGTKRDLAVIVGEDITVRELIDVVRSAGSATLESVTAFDEYRGPQLPQGKKSVALEVNLRNADRTITDAEADGAVNHIVAALQHRFNASLRGRPAT